MPTCIQCNQNKPQSEFARYKTSRNAGYRNVCRSCQNAYTRTYKRDHRQSRSERQRAIPVTKICRICSIEKPISEFRKNKSGYYQSYCKPCETEDSRKRANERYQSDPVKARKKQREWQKLNPDRAAQTVKRYHRTHPEKLREICNRKRSRQRALPHTFTDVDWRNAIEWWHGVCAYCGHSPSMFDVNPVLQQEHYIACAKGGGYTKENILPACQQCNFEKHDRDPQEWLEGKFGKRKAKQIMKRIQDYFDHIK